LVGSTLQLDTPIVGSKFVVYWTVVVHQKPTLNFKNHPFGPRTVSVWDRWSRLLKPASQWAIYISRRGQFRQYTLKGQAELYNSFVSYLFLNTKPGW